MEKKLSGNIKILVAISAIIFMLAAAIIYYLQSGSAAGKSTSEKAAASSMGDTKKKIKFAFRASGFDSFIEQSINNFEKQNDYKIEVEIVKIPHDKYDENLNMLFTTGERPDVFDLGYGWIGGYVTKEWIKNLKEFCDDEFLSRFPYWINTYTSGIYNAGELYSLPASQITIRLLYNKDLFNVAGINPYSHPETIEQLKIYAKKISDSQKGFKKYGFALNEGDERKCFEQFMEGANTYSGVNYFDYKKGAYSITSYAKWLSAIKEMKANGSLLPGSEILRYENALMLFAKGNIGMMYANSSAVKILSDLEKQNGKIADWEVALPPYLDEENSNKGKVSIIPSTFYCISSSTAHEEEAVRLWKYLYSEEHSGHMFKENGHIPVFADILNNPAYIPDIRHMNNFLPGYFDAVYPIGPKTVDDWSRFESYRTVLESDKPVEQILYNENENINYQYMNPSAVQKFLDPNADPNFDWVNPIKKK